MYVGLGREKRDFHNLALYVILCWNLYQFSNDIFSYFRTFGIEIDLFGIYLYIVVHLYKKFQKRRLMRKAGRGCGKLEVIIIQTDFQYGRHIG